MTKLNLTRTGPGSATLTFDDVTEDPEADPPPSMTEAIKARSRYEPVTLEEGLLVTADQALEEGQDELGKALQGAATRVARGILVKSLIKPQLGFMVKGPGGRRTPRDGWRYYCVETGLWAVFPHQVQYEVAAWGWTREHLATVTPDNQLQRGQDYPVLTREYRHMLDPAAQGRGGLDEGHLPDPAQESYRRMTITAQQVAMPSVQPGGYDYDGTEPPDLSGPITAQEAEHERLERRVVEGRTCAGGGPAPAVRLDREEVAFPAGLRIPDQGRENERRDQDPMFGRSTMGPPTDD